MEEMKRLIIRGITVLFFLFACLVHPAQAAQYKLDNSSPSPLQKQQANNPGASADQSFSQFLPIINNQKTSANTNLVDDWYLMVNDGHIIYREVPRVYHPFQKYSGNPVMRANLPWEGNIIQLYGTVLPGYRMWYSTYNKDWGLTQILYAESQDGIHWDKPFFDQTGTNALFDGDDANIVSVIHTPQFSESPFKFMVYQNDRFNGYSSMDGLNTIPYTGNPLFSNGEDVAHFYWDPYLQRYAGAAKEIHDIRGIYRRTMRLINSENFLDWNEQPELLSPDQVDDDAEPGIYPHFYGLPIFPIGEQYLGLLWILHATDIYGLYGKVNIQLVSSHDGNSWTREEANRPPILDVGPPGAWDDGQIYSASAPVRNGDELWQYYSGCNLEHGASLTGMVCSIGLAKAKYNRLASLTGSGVIHTGEIAPKGPYLHLNYDGSQGEVLVELIKNGQVIPGFEKQNCIPLTGDSLDQVVRWTTQVSLPQGSFQIKFYINSSSLFAFSTQAR